MGLGTFLFKSIAKSATRGVNHTVSSAITAAVVSGAATAASVAVSNYMNNKQQASRPQVQSNSSATSRPARNPYQDAMIGKVAVCYYVAKADGYISPAEQMEIDAIASELLSNSSFTPEAKHEFEKITHMQTISFSVVESYLSRVDSNTLVSFAKDVENIANASEGVLPAEAKAIDVFEKYVTAKTGYTFEKKKEEKKVTEVNLTCECCNGTMELDETYLKAVCPYCGAAKIIDASQISSVVSEIERTKRMKGEV